HRRHQRRQPADLPEPAQRDLRRRHLDRSGRPGQGARLGSDHAAGQRGLFAGRQPGRRAMSWDLPDPYVLELEVVANDIDELGHANNAVYVRWMERCAWSHSQSLGLDLAAYRQLDRAMAIVRHEVDYLAAAYQGERLRMGTWIVESDHKLRMLRRFQLIRPADGVTLLRAQTTFACIELSTGRPRRMPAEFVEGYGQALVATQP